MLFDKKVYAGLYAVIGGEFIGDTQFHKAEQENTTDYPIAETYPIGFGPDAIVHRCHFHQDSEQIGTGSGLILPVDTEHPANAYLVWSK